MFLFNTLVISSLWFSISDTDDLSILFFHGRFWLLFLNYHGEDILSELVQAFQCTNLLCDSSQISILFQAIQCNICIILNWIMETVGGVLKF